MTEQEAAPGAAGFVCDWPRIADAVAKVGKVSVPERPRSPILGGVRFTAEAGGLVVYAMNYATATAVQLDDVAAEGALVVEWKMLDGILQGAKKRWTEDELNKLEVTLTAVGARRALLKIGRYHFPLEAWDPDEYPTVLDTTKQLAVVAGDDFAAAAAGVVKAAGTDEVRPALTGVQFRLEGEDDESWGLQLFATDRYRIAGSAIAATSVVDPLRTDGGVLVPALTLAALGPWFAGHEVVIGCAQNPEQPKETAAMSFAGGGVRVWTRAIKETAELPFPKLDKALESGTAVASLEQAADLLSEVKRAAATAKGSGADAEQVELTFHPHRIDVGGHIRGARRQPSTTSVKATVEGLCASLRVQFTARYLMEALDPFGERPIDIHPMARPKNTAIVDKGGKVARGSRLVQVLAPLREAE